MLNALRSGRQEDRRGEAGVLAAPARPASPASTCWWRWASSRENILALRPRGRGLHGPRRRHGRRTRRATRATPTRARWPTSSTAPTCSSACRPPACSSRRWSTTHGRRPDHPRAGQSQSGDHAGRGQGARARTRSSPPAAPTIPNQVNNALCFPYIFRGALDVGATTINEPMKLACVRAIAELARGSVRPRRSLRRRDAVLRPRVPDPASVRSAPAGVAGAGGGAGRDGFGRGHAADRGHGRLPREARPSSCSAPAW